LLIKIYKIKLIIKYIILVIKRLLLIAFIFINIINIKKVIENEIIFINDSFSIIFPLNPFFREKIINDKV
tara:strand:+ start:1620 stop:1829 length:210 start_codon:yes stop_codon:yes gene_type:complete